MKPTRKQLEAENQRLRQLAAEALEAENTHLRRIAAELHWMARRYADGRRGYATSSFNNCVRDLLSMGVKLSPGTNRTIWATDAMGRAYDGLTDAEATPGTPEARGEATNEAN
jgi:hypothetical protein